MALDGSPALKSKLFLSHISFIRFILCIRGPKKCFLTTVFSHIGVSVGRKKNV